MSKIERMPGFQEVNSTYPAERARPQIVEMNGKPFLMIEADNLTTGYTGRSQDALEPTITIYAEAPSAGAPGMALFFRPEDEMLSVLIEGLQLMQQRSRAQAATQAGAALRKAAGR